MGDATRLYPTIAKQKRQKQRLRANNEELAEQLEETEDELQQAVNTANWNYECAQHFLTKLKNTSEALEVVKESRERTRETRREESRRADENDSQRLSWKRTIIRLYQEGKIDESREEILERQEQHLEETRQEIQAARAEKMEKAKKKTTEAADSEADSGPAPDA